MTSPSVSVLMPVYNGERFLREAVESILGQTFTDFEFIIVDDGSTDGTKKILDGYKDSRIVRINNETNMGLIASLNKGIGQARGEYIARMDADDISLPKRLQLQTDFLLRFPEIGIVGSSLIYIDENGHEIAEISNIRMKYHGPPGLLQWTLFFDCSLAHPAVMIRRTIIERLSGYCSQYLHAEDYELWLRATKITKIANISHPLLKLRFHSNRTSFTHTATQILNANIAVALAVESLLSQKISIEDIRRLRNWYRISTKNELLQTARMLVALYYAFTAKADLTIGERMLIQKDVGVRLSNGWVIGVKMNGRSAISLLAPVLKTPLYSQMTFFQTLLGRIIRSILQRSSMVVALGSRK